MTKVEYQGICTKNTHPTIVVFTNDAKESKLANNNAGQELNANHTAFPFIYLFI